MIRIRDAARLAATKLKTRTVRLTITVVISGLLFSGLVAASLVMHGAFSSLNYFNTQGLGSQFIIQGMAVPKTVTFGNDLALLQKATDARNEQIARKKAEAKRLGIEYDATAEPQIITEYDSPQGKVKTLNIDSTLAQQVANEYYSGKNVAAGIDTFEASAKHYGARGTFYRSKQMPFIASGSLRPLKEGKESFDNQPDIANTGLDSFTNQWIAMDDTLMKPFIFKGQSLDIDHDGTIPIVIPYSAARELTKSPKTPESASAQMKLDALNAIRAKAAATRFSLCYRNATSVEQVQKAQQQAVEIEAGKTKKDYVKPDLVYGLPTEACGSVQVIRDVRTKTQKADDAKQETFDELFGKVVAQQATINFRVVGIVPDMFNTNATGVSQLVSSLVTSNLGSGWFTPYTVLQANPLVGDLFKASAITPSNDNYYASFASSTQARSFLEKENCDLSKMDANGESSCTLTHTPFLLSSFGSNSLALEDFKHQFNRIFLLATLAVALLGAIIMMGTVGRMIADSRRETAVFRAIGAQKIDIVQIYLLYTLAISVLVAAFACAVGYGVARYVDGRWAVEATTQATLVYNIEDPAQTFSLLSFNVRDLCGIVVIIILSGVLSSIVPLARNIRRNPIKDMRDDT